MDYPDGIHQISNEDYHASSALSRSALMSFKRSPFHYFNEYLVADRPAKEVTAAMILGELVHTLVLEPAEAQWRYAIKPEFDRRTKQGKYDYERWILGSGLKKVVNADLYKTAEEMAKQIIKQDLGINLIQYSKIENSIFFRHKITGIQCKVRPDIWNQTIVTDLKTTADASYNAFQSSAFKYGYFLQAAMIHQGLESLKIFMEKFVIIAVEKTYPYAVGFFVLDQDAIDYGIQQFNELMHHYQICARRDSFSGYGLKTLCVPSYAKFYEFQEIEND